MKRWLEWGWIRKVIGVLVLGVLLAVLLGGCGKRTNVLDDKYRTFYEVFVFSFYDGNGDGVGDFKGLTEKLDYINDGKDGTDSDLGCNGIWLMPIMPSETYHKYDVTDYYGIDAQYGTMEEFDAFMEACGKRDIHVLIDLVINHSSSKHPWFVQACEYLKGLDGKEPSEEECPYFGYYQFSKEKKSGAWYPVQGTDWYYEAPFWSEMPDLNLYNENVRKEISDVAAFWLDKGVAGFRLDAAKEYVSDNTGMNVEILTWFNDMVKEKEAEAYIVAEVWTDMSTYAQYYASGIDSCFDFAFASQSGMIAGALNGTGGGNAASYGKAAGAVDGILAKYSEAYIDAPFYTNHDMGRSAGYYAGEGSEEKTKIAQAMNLLMSGNAFLYYGEELGMKGAGKDENKRAPMYWSMDTEASGMCDGPPDMEAVKMKFESLEEQEKDAASVYQYVKDVIKVRNRFPEIARGNSLYLEAVSDEKVCVFKKVYGEEELVLVYNLSPDAVSVNLTGVQMGKTDAGRADLKACVLTGEAKVEKKGAVLSMPAYSVAVIK